MIAVDPATAAAHKPATPTLGRQRHRYHERREESGQNEPVCIADPLDKLKPSLIAGPMRESTRAGGI